MPKSLLKRSTRALALASASGLALIAGLTGGAATAAAKTQTIACHGGSSSCTATIGLAGGASNKKLRITLTDTDLKLVSVVAKPNSVKGAYNLSKRSYSVGGSVFNVTLNAVQSIGKGATLTLKFAVPKK
ncbi:MAG TPA: hypothetical protein VL988_08390 [Solirubrobacteraceae bacterium]|nr:hypothetical protein [Solirubrobacteraceae bacterium]